MDLANWLHHIAAVCTGLTAGVYLAFSAMVMPAFERGAPAGAVTIMQDINRYALRPPFMLPFGAGAAASAGLLIATLTGVDASGWHLLGAGLSLATFVSTAVYNVPLNNRIDALRPSTPTDLATWADLARRWVWGNHVRAVVATAALAAFVA